MELVILQTSDAFRYSRMLRATSQTAIAYCERHGFAYESFIGIKRGFRGAHAAFNRIMMLDELVDRGYRGWALHMDADAYVYDLDFDLRAYLADKQDRSAIMATIPGEHVPWHINSGVLFFNLGHPQGIALIRDWKRRFMAISDARLRELTSVWDGENDQIMLYKSLDRNEALREPVFFEDASLFNDCEGRFIRQYLNSLEGDLARRTEAIEAAVIDIFRNASGASASAAEEKLVGELYRAILRRNPDPGSRGYVDLLLAKGTGAVPEIVRSLIDSPEYQGRLATEAASPTGRT